ncbi:unnamed protein product, partial [Owenia fusiformis]
NIFMTIFLSLIYSNFFRLHHYFYFQEGHAKGKGKKSKNTGATGRKRKNLDGETDPESMNRKFKYQHLKNHPDKLLTTLTKNHTFIKECMIRMQKTEPAG